MFEAALRLPPEQREAYLEQACAGDAALRQRIQALLQAHEGQKDFLTTGASAAGRTISLAVSLPPAEQPGTRIGPYKLLQQIGEGGCGVVYMAEQEELRSAVAFALKIIKIGMDTEQVIARFASERQALARLWTIRTLIAKVFDAGATETGRPTLSWNSCAG